MPKRVRARSSRTTPPANQHSGECANRSSASPGATPIELHGRKRTGTCPVCGKNNLDVSDKNMGCFSCEADGLASGDWIRAVATVFGVSGDKVLADRWTLFADYLDRPGSRPAAPRVQITPAHIDGWASRLASDDRALAWLHARRLTDETIRTYRLGYDGDKDAIVIPVYEDGEPVRIKWRFLDPNADPKTLNSPDSAKLYPDVPKRGALLFVAGEIDALIGRQMGLPTVSTTCGAKLPARLAPAFADRRVFLMFDVGEDPTKAAMNARAVGADVTVIDLAELGLPHGGDLNDLYLAGGTADDVKALCRRAAA